MQAQRQWAIVAIRCMPSVVFAVSPLKSQTAWRSPVQRSAKVEPQPNTVNAVPETTFTIDCRHTDAAVLREFTEQLENDMRAICCDEMDISTIMICGWTSAGADERRTGRGPSPLCETEQLNYRISHSGAGHDAQPRAPRVPTCMIFVPSINGISHNPAERTNINDLAEGVKNSGINAASTCPRKIRSHQWDI